MPGHFRDFAWEYNTPGEFLIPQDLPNGLVVDTLILVWAATDASEWQNRLCLARLHAGGSDVRHKLKRTSALRRGVRRCAPFERRGLWSNRRGASTSSRKCTEIQSV